MEKIKIKGKDYVMVNERLKYFRENYKGWSLTSELVSLTDGACVIKAIVCDETGRVMATGLAQEDKSSSMINKTSFVENCETSAWGRALGNLGIGIDESVASAEEVDMAIRKQERLDLLGGAYTFASGKYKDKTIEEVAQVDNGYLDYLLLNEQISDNIKSNIRYFRNNGDVSL